MKKRILIIEDDVKVARALGVRLSAAGYEVLEARNGLEGLQRAIKERPDLVITDIWMPVGIGFSIMQRLHTLGLEKVPIIVLTASHKRGLCETAHQLGARAFFEKPLNMSELLEAISAALGEEEARVALPATTTGIEKKV